MLSKLSRSYLFFISHHPCEFVIVVIVYVILTSTRTQP